MPPTKEDIDYAMEHLKLTNSMLDDMIAVEALREGLTIG
jgi:hypothetical protein